MMAILPWLVGAGVMLWCIGVCWLVVEARRAPVLEAPHCDLCLVPGEFPELHESVPGRYCSQCAMAIVEVRALTRARRKA